MAKQSLYELFLELAQPDELGFSRIVYDEEFIEKYAELKLGNGLSWGRKTSKLAQKFNVVPIYKGAVGKSKVIGVKLDGINYKSRINKKIPKSINNEIKKQKCRVLAVSGVETDHKDGFLDAPDIENTPIEGFQPLHSAVNVAKRQHCKRCRETRKRFDATQLGYPVGQVRGNGNYNNTCVGCYWHDPFFFNQQMKF